MKRGPTKGSLVTSECLRPLNMLDCFAHLSDLPGSLTPSQWPIGSKDVVRCLVGIVLGMHAAVGSAQL